MLINSENYSNLMEIEYFKISNSYLINFFEGFEQIIIKKDGKYDLITDFNIDNKKGFEVSSKGELIPKEGYIINQISPSEAKNIFNERGLNHRIFELEREEWN